MAVKGKMVHNYKKKREKEIDENDITTAVSQVVNGHLKLSEAASAYNIKMAPPPSVNVAPTSGYRYSEPLPGEEIYITGISGYFPESKNIKELSDNLFAKKDLITDDDRRWKNTDPEVPHRTGKICDLEKFDASFFDIHYKQAHTMDAMSRMLMQSAYECIIDAGYNPSELRKYRTGVFVGSSLSESEQDLYYYKMHVNDHGILGTSRVMLAANISQWLGVTGPAYCVDSACSSSLYALEQAVQSIRDGLCEAAIVGGCNLCLHPMVSHRFAKSRGESLALTFGWRGLLRMERLERQSEHRVNNQSINNQSTAMNDCSANQSTACAYTPAPHPANCPLGVLSPDARCKCFDNSANGYVRAETVSTCFLQKAKHSRRVHAEIVHIKTNCDGYKSQGITYPAGPIQQQLLEGFYAECGIAPQSLEYIEAHGTGTRVGDPEELNAIDRVFCAGRVGPLKIGSVKSNLGHSEAGAGVCALAKLVIAYNTGFIPPNIWYKTPREGVPALSEGRFKVVTDKEPWGRGLAGISSFGFGGANAHTLLKNAGKNKVRNGLPSDDLPRLVCVSGRTESAVAKILDDLESRTIDVEEIRLWHAIHERDIRNHLFRGYTLLGSSPTRSIGLGRSVEYFQGDKRPLWFVYSGLGSQWPIMVKQLLKIPVFAAAIKKCHKVLESKSIDLTKIITDPSGKFDILNSFIGIAAVQIGLTDILGSVNIKPDHIIGHNVGELGCAYAEGCLTAEQAILAAYSMGLAFSEAKLTLPDSSSETYQSRFTKDVAAKLMKFLKEIIVSPKPRSERWASTSRQEKGQLSSAEYYVNSLLEPADLDEEIKKIHPNAIVLEIAPHSLMQDKLNDPCQKKITKAALGDKNEDSLQFMCIALGKLYEAGLNPHVANLYPAVSFPVSQGTPCLSHQVEWDHCENWFLPSFAETEQLLTTERTIKVTLDDEDSEYLLGHCIDGRVLIPATAYLEQAWATLAMFEARVVSEVSVVFENVCFHRATTLPREGTLEFTITIQKRSGNFEIIESGVSVVTGRIYVKKDVGKDYRVIPESKDNKKEADGVVLYNKDFYKELNLRGYQYKDLFRGVLGCTVDGTRGRLRWDNNWVTFLDTMLQPKIVTYDTRSLYVPTRIEKLSIDVDIHYNILGKMDPFAPLKSFEFRFYPNIDIIRVSGVEIRGLHVTAIAKRPPLGIPVFERNEFISNYRRNNMKLEDITRIDLQLVFENIQTYKFKCIELVDEEYKNNNLKPIIEKVGDVLADLPLVQADLQLFTEDPIEMPSNITIVNKKLTGESNTIVFIGANLLKRPNVIIEGLSALKEQCFILSREKILPEPQDYDKLYDIVNMYKTGVEFLVLLRKKIRAKPMKCIKIITADLTFAWIDQVKEEMKDAKKLVLYSEFESVNGLLGLVNCLRREPGGETIYGVLIADPSAPSFDTSLKFYKDQLEKDLAINVYKNGQWGTYRHLLLEDLETVPSPHAYVNTTTIGDLSSLSWLQGPLIPNQTCAKPEHKLVHVYCSAMNFRDVMTAMGRVTLDAVARGRIAQDCVQGIEVSGKTSSGIRVMAISEKAISNLVVSEESVMWPVPDEWTLEEAATIPVAYCTVYMAMVMMGKIRRGETILIHAGSGGVGQAAISVALHYGLEVFTTVGTPAKRQFIKKLFPQLKDSNIGNSRDTSFVDMVRQETNGKGVDLVLNSLADDKLQASIKCLGHRGRFLEIGKYDITNNTLIQTCFLKKEISFHGVMLDFINDAVSLRLRKSLRDLILTGIASGAVRPLTRCTFEKNEIEAAYRYMAAGKHIGKVIIKIREEESTRESVAPKPVLINALHRYNCNPDRVYVLIGGLGGFGLELVDWLVIRGARKIILTSRRGISNGYQAMRLRIWKSYGANIQISTHDVTTEDGCKQLLELANSLGTVEAIFNLAVILKDAVFQNQTQETFKTSFAPKALATIQIDNLSRKLCPQLKDFVIFSSVSCGRGNAGQTNYGFSNSVMERICEERKNAGLPALAIQWGAIGDVGLVADMQEDNIQLEIGGTLQQRIVSCLQAMDKFLKQDAAAVVSSIVVAEKRSGGADSGSCVDAVANIMGIKDLKTVSQQAPLAELGMDSIMSVEIKQTLERDFEIFLNAQEIRSLTYAKLQELSASGGADGQVSTTTNATPSAESAGLSLFMRNFGDETMASKPYVYMRTLVSDGTKEHTIKDKEPIMFLLPGMESCASALEIICSKLDIKACVLQLGLDCRRDTLENMTDRLYQTVKSKLAPGAPFQLLGYSFGTLPMLLLAATLESEVVTRMRAAEMLFNNHPQSINKWLTLHRHRGIVFLIDGSPDYLYEIARSSIPISDDSLMQNTLILQSFNILMSNTSGSDVVMAEIIKCKTFDEKIARAFELLPIDIKYSSKFLTSMSNVSFERIKIMYRYGDKTEQKIFKKIKSPIILIRPKQTHRNLKIENDYGLGKFCERSVTVHCVEADHTSILELTECADIINSTLAGIREDHPDKSTANIITNMIENPPRTVKI